MYIPRFTVHPVPAEQLNMSFNDGQKLSYYWSIVIH